MKKVDMGEPTSFLDHIYLGCTQRQCETSKGMVDDDRTIFECRIFAVSWEKLSSSENWVLLNGPTIWKVMSGNTWNVIVSMSIKLLNNFTKYQLHVLMTINSEKQNWNPWKNCQMYALKLFWHVCIWTALVDLIFLGQSTNLRVRSQNGPEHVQNV